MRIRRRVTVERYLNEIWLPSAARTIRPSTLFGYRAHVRNYLVPHLGRIQLHRLTADRLNAFYLALAQSNCARRNKPPGATTIRRIHATLHRALNDAVKWGYLEVNPAASCDPPRAQGDLSHMRTWTHTEVARFLSLTAGHPLHELWLLLVTTGMRRGEVLALRWRDLDLDNATAAVRRSVSVVDNQIRISAPKSARSRRIVALDDTSVQTMEALHRRTSAGADDLVFSRDGRPLDPVRVSKEFRRVVADTDLPRIRLHDLRHTHATLALRAGIHPKIVSERLGHSTVSLTLDVYSHAVPNMQVEAAQRIADVIFNDK